MINFKHIENIINVFKNCELIDLLGDNSEEIIEINLKDKFDKGYEFQNDCKAMCNEIYDYLLNNGFNGYCVSGIRNNEKEYNIKFVKTKELKFYINNK